MATQSKTHSLAAASPLTAAAPINPPPAQAPEKTHSQLVREQADKMARNDEAIQLRAVVAMVKNTSWGANAPEHVIMATEKLARKIGLSFALGDMLILGGNPYVALAGRLRAAHDTKEFNGFVERPLGKDEYQIWGVRADAEYAWICEVHRTGYEHPFIEVGWGGGTREVQANQGKGQPVAKAFPAEMARKRARARALQLAFPLPLPALEEIPYGQQLAIPDELYNKAIIQAAAGEGTIQMPRRASEAKADPEPQAEPEPHVSSAMPTPEELRELEAAEQADMLRGAQ